MVIMICINSVAKIATYAKIIKIAPHKICIGKIFNAKIIFSSSIGEMFH